MGHFVRDGVSVEFSAAPTEPSDGDPGLPAGRMPSGGWIALAAAFLLCDVAIAPCMRQWGPQTWGALFVYAPAGPLFAQLGLLPAWLALGNRPYWPRFTLHWLAVLGVATAIFGGVVVAGWMGDRSLRARDVEAACALVLVLPVMSLAIESPLWFLRWAFGWQIAGGNRRSPPRKLAIRDLMLATALVAVALALARLSTQLQDGGRSADFWPALGIAVGVAAAGSAILLPPIIWMVLRVKDLNLAILGFVAHAGILAAIFVAVVAINRWTPSRSLWGVFGTAVTTITFALGLSATFWFARAQGYWLIVKSDH